MNPMPIKNFSSFFKKYNIISTPNFSFLYLKIDLLLVMHYHDTSMIFSRLHSEIDGVITSHTIRLPWFAEMLYEERKK